MTTTWDKAQLHAIEHERGPMLVLAGAGTGKTSVLVERIHRLVSRNLAAPDEILAVSYTENATAELRQRVAANLGLLFSTGAPGTTFHGYCYGLLRRAGREFGLLTAESDLWIYMRRRVAELPLSRFIKAANLGQFLTELNRFFTRCHDELITPEDYERFLEDVRAGRLPAPRVSKPDESLSQEETLARCQEIADTYRQVEEMLRADKLYTFGHLISESVRLLQSDPQLLAVEQKRYRYILIDEFQDTNMAQITLAELLAGKRQNVFAVGDPDQAIYRFRGASSWAFEEFLARYPRAALVRLQSNYRSTTPILRLAHAVISRNPEVGSGSERFAGFAREPLESERDRQRVMGATDVRRPVAISIGSSYEAEAGEVAAALAKLHEREPCGKGHCAVLYRLHAHKDILLSELARQGTLFAVANLDLLGTPEVRDLIACLTALAFPEESLSLLRVASLTQFGVNGDELVGLLWRKHDPDLRALLSALPEGQKVLSRLDEVRSSVALETAAAAEVCNAVMQAFDLKMAPATALAIRRFVEQWQEKPTTKTKLLPEFLEYLKYYQESGGVIAAQCGSEEVTQLMSVHSAKGLEFRHVFVLRATSQSFPGNFREPLFEFPARLLRGYAPEVSERELHPQEERRLFYVAMTRARDTLTISSKRGQGKKDPTPPGYLRELMSESGLRHWWQERSAREPGLAIAASVEPQSGLASWLLAPFAARELGFSLSATAIDRYQQCPLQFKLAHEWRIQSEPTASLLYGEAMHKALKFLGENLAAKSMPSEAEVLRAFRESFRSAMIHEPLQVRLLEEQAARQLHAFMQSHSGKARPDVISAEQSFSFDVSGIKVRGRIDRIDRLPEGRVAIIDYKTGNPQTQEDADESVQLSLYALAARECWQLSPDRLTYYNLETDSAVSTSRTSAQLARIAALVRETADLVREGRFDPKPGYHCRWCNFNLVCPTQEERLYNIEVNQAVPALQVL